MIVRAFWESEREVAAFRADWLEAPTFQGVWKALLYGLLNVRQLALLLEHVESHVDLPPIKRSQNEVFVWSGEQMFD